MFTGIIETVGAIAAMQTQGEDLRVSVHGAGLDMSDVALGDSIAVNGVCLTAVWLDEQGFSADVSAETLNNTSFSQLTVGSRVNLEKALTPTTRLGGHLVSGHVDGVGEVLQRYNDGRSVRFRIQAPSALARYIARKGSITVDGISLTVNDVTGAEFTLNIVPHTLAETTLQDCKVGQKVNLEVDLIARYLERLVLGERAAREEDGGISEAFLAEHGFLSSR
ncbi:MAG: riboflavin synthase [Pseudomonadota bacterium]